MKSLQILLSLLFITLLPTSVFAEEQLSDEAWSLQEALTPKDKEWKRSEIATVPKFGGYIIGSYKYDDVPGNHGGEGFGLRLIRLYVDGTVMKDFKYRLQAEMSGAPGVDKGPRIIDATIEWAHWKEFSIKAGQFKRAFTFENPMNPWDIGNGNYSQLTLKMAGMSDRCGEHGSGGRDLGIQFQGDLFRSKKDGHAQFHYQAAVYNGQGINHRDENGKKDFIGTLQWIPMKGLTFGAFGWHGSYVNSSRVTIDRKRYALGMKYEGSKNWSARAEYARGKDAQHYDAWYAMVGIPVWRWIKCYVKYDAYRSNAMSNNTLHSIYGATVNLQPHKNVMLQLQYNWNDDKTIAHHHYNQLWAQTYIRF